MTFQLDRRHFLAATSAASASLAFGKRAFGQAAEGSGKLFDISLAQWSLNRQFFGFLGGNRGDQNNKLNPQDFPIISKDRFGIDAVEYVNQFYKEAVNQPEYVKEMKKKADDAGVRSVLIMCDGEGSLGDPDENKRMTAVKNHVKWLEWAKFLGCHSIRVNAASSGSYEEQQKLAADGLRRLAEIGDKYELNVIVENHGGYSSHGRWLHDVMKMVDHPRCGTLPDFGNFHIQRGENGLEYDRYLGTYELMPFAKGVSAKAHEFDEQGNEKSTDFERMLKIVLDSGFRGYVGIEFEGGNDPFEGIQATKALLERVRDKLSA